MCEWDLDFTGKAVRVDGRRIRVEEQLTEVTQDTMAQRHVLCLAHYEDTMEEVMLKIRYDLDPEDFDIEDYQQHREAADRDFLNEAELVEDVHEIGHGPRYIHHTTRHAGRSLPYPPGFVETLVMGRVPGENVGDIFLELSHEQLESIRTQLAYILEHMRLNWVTLSEQDPDFLRYDRENDKLYIIDFTFMSITDPDDGVPITVDDMYVLAFNIWREDISSPPSPASPQSPE